MKAKVSFLLAHLAAFLVAAAASAQEQAQKAAPAAAQKSVAQKATPQAAQKSVAQKASPAAQKAAPQAAQKSSWQKIAEDRASRMAARRYRGHLPGLPGGIFEGVGWGGPNCATCVGSGALLADAQAVGADGLTYRVRFWEGGGGRIRVRGRIFRRTRWRRR